MLHDSCIFCKIIRGEIPSYKIYEDEHIFSFLDISPLSEGHSLVIPKQHKVFFHELDEEYAASVGKAVSKIAAVISENGKIPYNILNNNGSEAGQVVQHVHVHIVPKRGDSGLTAAWTSLNEKIDFKTISEKYSQELKKKQGI